MTRVSVMPYARVVGWPDNERGESVHVADLAVALEREYPTDAHLVQYVTPNGRRLNRQAIERLDGIELEIVVFDIDGPTHGSSEPAPEKWRRELREKVQSLATEHPQPYYYETRGGARIVYRQAEPTVLRTQADAQQWSRSYAVAVAYLARRFDIHADPACNDWQRLFRLPHATRTPGGRPENWPTFGDATDVGALLIDAEPTDVRAARRESRAFANRGRAFVPSIAAGEGLLYYLLRARGDIAGEAPRGGWICRCPNRAAHTSNTDGTDSTVVYPPIDGSEVGSICCKHGHCENIRVSRWLRFFSERELQAARQRAGIKRSA